MSEMLFNFRSGKQMQEFLYEFLKLTPLKEKNEKGNYSVAEEVLTTYAEKEGVEFCKKLMQYRKLDKNTGTTIKGVERNLINGYLHSDFWLNIAATGRSSSSGMNMQNFGNHGEIYPGIPQNEIRKIFSIPPETESLILPTGVKYTYPRYLVGEVDYVGAEVKVCALLTQDKQLMEDLNNDMDQHSHWANILFGLNQKDLSEIKKHHPEKRFIAKNSFTFATLFGASHFSIAESFRAVEFYRAFVRTIFEKEKGVFQGKEYSWDTYFKLYSEWNIENCQKAFFERYHKTKEWQDNLLSFYDKHGYIENPFGFRRRYPLTKNEIINFPIQSTSFHLLLHGMIVINKKLKEANMNSQMRLQVHDSIFFYIHYDEIEQVIKMANSALTENDFEWCKGTNLEVDWEVGNNWVDTFPEGVKFKAKHLKSGTVIEENILHWFAKDFNIPVQDIHRALNGEKDDKGHHYKVKGWEFSYV